MNILLVNLAETSKDKSIQDYKKAIEFYSDKLDNVNISQEEINGKKRLVIEPAILGKELTIAELFKKYAGERNYISIQELGEAVDNEKW